MKRENDIQTLCKAVLENAIQDHYSTADGDCYCVFCRNDGSRENLIHAVTCPVLIAKDLCAGINNTPAQPKGDE
jgi:hypothetical protein